MVVDGCLWSLPIAMPTTARVLALRGARPLLLVNLFMLQKLIWESGGYNSAVCRFFSLRVTRIDPK